MAEEEKKQGDYQVLPVEELKKLKREIEYLKQGSPAAASTEDFVDSTNKLTEKIDGLQKIFEDATDEMRKEDKETQLLSERVEPLLEKIDILMDQNRKIAKGLVVIADLVKDMQAKQAIKVVKKEETKPMPKPMGPPEMAPPRGMPPPGPGPMPPPGAPPIPGGFSDMPPPIRSGAPMPPPPGMAPSPGPMPPPAGVPPLPKDMGMPPPPPMPEKKKGFFK